MKPALLRTLSVVAVEAPLRIPDLKALVVESKGLPATSADAKRCPLIPRDRLAASVAELADAVTESQLRQRATGQTAVLDSFPDDLPHDAGLHKSEEALT